MSAIGDSLTSVIFLVMQDFKRSTIFFSCAGLMVVNTAIFCRFAMSYTPYKERFASFLAASAARYDTIDVPKGKASPCAVFTLLSQSSDSLRSKGVPHTT